MRHKAMEFALTPEQKMFQQAVREFGAKDGRL